MSESPADPDQRTIREALTQLVTEGLSPRTVGNADGKLVELLELQVVQSRLAGDVDEDDDDAMEQALTEALIDVLRKAVKDNIKSGKFKKVLKCVLPLREELATLSLADRRSAAAEAIEGRRALRGSTIRTYYEPKALDLLASALVRMEAAHGAVS